MRSRVLRVAVAGAVVAGTWWLTGGSADTAELTDASWWYRANATLPAVGASPAPVPAPPTVPEGGLLVAGAPDGATAVAAVRYELAEGESNPTLTLTVAENGDQGGAGAVLGACVAGSAWGGGEVGGPWESKPNAACETGSVQGVRSEDGKTFSFGLAPLVVGREVNVVITPGTIAPDAPVGSTFSLAFNPPTTAALATTPGDGSSGGGLVLDESIDVLPDPVTGLDPGSLFSADTVSAFTPALPSSSQGLTATAPVVRQQSAGNVLPRPARAKNGAVAFLVILGALVALVRLNKVPVPNLRLLGPLGSTAATAAVTVTAQPAETGGLGRFARRRVGTPPPLV